jgi:hypothetical protein
LVGENLIAEAARTFSLDVGKPQNGETMAQTFCPLPNANAMGKGTLA